MSNPLPDGEVRVARKGRDQRFTVAYSDSLRESPAFHGTDYSPKTELNAAAEPPETGVVVGSGQEHPVS